MSPLSELFYFEGSSNKAGLRFSVSNIAPDLAAVRFVRTSANFIPRNAPVIADVDDINNNVGFILRSAQETQPDFRIPERISAGLTTFPDLELEAIYEDLVKTFVEYQTNVALRSIALSPFTALTTDDATALAAANALLDPRNAHDLGGLTAAAAPVAPGSYRVARLTIQALAGTPLGTYTVQVAPGAVLTDEDFNDVDLPSATFTVTVAAAPEPATLTLFALAPFAFLARRRRC